MKEQIPGIAKKFLRKVHFSKGDEEEYIQTVEENYIRIREEKGKFCATAYLWWEIAAALMVRLLTLIKMLLIIPNAWDFLMRLLKMMIS